MKSFLSIVSGFAFVNLLRALVPFLLLPFLTRFLSPSDYGVLSVVETGILLLVPLMLFNAQGLFGSRYYKIDKQEVAKLSGNALLVAAGSFLLVEFVFILCRDSLNALVGVHDSFLLLVPVFVFFRVLNVYIASVLQIQHKVKRYGVFTIGTLLLDLVFSVLLVANFDFGYQGRLLGAHGALLIFAVTGGVWLVRDRLLNFTFSKAIVMDILKYGLPLIPHALGGVALALAGRFVLANKIGTESVGIFSVSYQVASVMLLVGTTINQAWSVSLYKLLSGDLEVNKKLIKKTMLLIFLFLFFICLFIYLARDVVFFVLSSDRYFESKQYFPFLLMAFFLQSVYFVFVNFDFYEEKVYAIGVTTLVVACTSFVLNLYLIPLYGIWGAVYANLLSMFLYVMIVVFRVSLLNKSFKRVWFE